MRIQNKFQVGFANLGDIVSVNGVLARMIGVVVYRGELYRLFDRKKAIGFGNGVNLSAFNPFKPFLLKTIRRGQDLCYINGSTPVKIYQRNKDLDFKVSDQYLYVGKNEHIGKLVSILSIVSKEEVIVYFKNNDFTDVIFEAKFKDLIKYNSIEEIIRPVSIAEF